MVRCAVCAWHTQSGLKWVLGPFALIVLSSITLG